MIFRGKKLLERFTKMNCKKKKKNQKEFRTEKVIKRKGNKLYIKWKRCNTSFNSWIDKKEMSEYLPKPNSLGSNVKVELDLSNYATNRFKKCNRS